MRPSIISLDSGERFVVREALDLILKEVLERRQTRQPFIGLHRVACSDFKVWRPQGRVYIDVHAVDAIEEHSYNYPYEETTNEAY